MDGVVFPMPQPNGRAAVRGWPLVMSSQAAAVYRRLLDAHVLRLDELATTSGVDELVRLGVVMRRPDRIMLVDPATAIRQAVTAAHERFSQEVDALVALVSEIYHHDQRVPSWAGSAEAPFTLLSDPQRNCLLTGQLRLNAQQEVRTFFTAGQPAWAKHGVNPITPHPVTVRTVVETGVLAQPGSQETLQKAVERGEAVRAVAQLPLRMMIVDQQVAYVGLDASGVRAAAIVRAQHIVAALIDYFEYAWRSAVPVSVTVAAEAADHGPSPVQRRILQLLATGVSDEAIARQCNVSARTVRRHVADLLTECGSNTRFSLAVEAIRRGWLKIDT
jgi:DNA-binding CsgD family transcriptional regulator